MLAFIVATLLNWLVFMPIRFRCLALGKKGPSIVAKAIPTLIAAGLAAWAAFGTGGGMGGLDMGMGAGGGVAGVGMGAGGEIVGAGIGAGSGILGATGEIISAGISTGAGISATGGLLGAGTYARLIFAGLCVCALADVFLEIRFEAGGALFFCGHVLYVLALAGEEPPTLWSLCVFVPALAGLWLFVAHYRKRVPTRFILFGLTVYAVALAALLGLSLPPPFLRPSPRAWLAALGAALFVLSDLTLCHNTVHHKPPRWHYVSLGVYYTGQLLLAMSAFPTA